MELLTLPSLLYILASLTLLLLSIWFLQNRVTASKSNLPPGPWTLPIIGSLHHLAVASLPHHALHNLAQLYGPVMFLRAGQTNLVVITSREAAKEVMKTQDANFGNRPQLYAANILLYGSSDILFSNGLHWRQLRRICSTELFTLRRVKSFSSIRQKEINAMMKSILASENSQVNLSAMSCELSTNIVTNTAFGGRCTTKDRALFLENLGQIVELLSGFTIFDLFPSLSWLDLYTRRKLLRVQRKLDLVMERVLQEHLKQPRKVEDEELKHDLVDVLINVMESDRSETPITTDVIKAIILDLFAGGTESSSTTITWVMTELIKNPTIMAKVQAEIRSMASSQSEEAKLDHNKNQYLKLVIKETMRIHPVAPFIAPRLCKESCEVLGHTIPSETKVIINAWSLGRNPAYWNDPEDFKPERFLTCDVDFRGQHFELLPFGAGRRICPGIEYGMAVVEETLTSLLLHFDWKLPDGMKPEDVDMTEVLGITASKKEPLYLIPTLRVPFNDV